VRDAIHWRHDIREFGSMKALVGLLRRLANGPLSSFRLPLIVAAAALAAAIGPSHAAPGDDVYTRPGTIVSAGGARLNFVCRGQGSPTVVFDSGWGDWAPAWAVVQPRVAAFTQACSYDRAGAGFSEPGPMPRTSVVIARELRAALKGAGIDGPYILVASAFGGDPVRSFADLYSSDVAGLVLDDADASDVEPEALQADDHSGQAGLVAEMRACRDAIAAQKPLPTFAGRPGGARRTCEGMFFRGLPEAMFSPALNAKLLALARTRATMYDAFASEMEEMPSDEAWLKAHRRTLGARPVRILTSGEHGVGEAGGRRNPTPEHIKYEEQVTHA
jgi:pimeloyl-ACP methyl ester carboxylesterase